MTLHLALQRMLLPSAQVSALTTGSITLPSARGAYSDVSEIVSLATATITSAGANITFSGIPQTYKHLELRVLGRSTNSGTACDEIRMRLGNGSIDSGSNYSWQHLYGSGTSASATYDINTSFMRIGFVSRDGNNSNLFQTTIIRIADYTSTKRKVVTGISGGANSGSQAIAAICDGLWNNTSAITDIGLYTELNWQVGSYVTLYGVA